MVFIKSRMMPILSIQLGNMKVGIDRNLIIDVNADTFNRYIQEGNGNSVEA